MKPQSIGICVLAALLVLACWRVSVVTGDRDALEERLATRTLERDTARRTAEGWEKQAEEAETKIRALQDEAQACLTREQEATATAEQWRAILETAKSRDMAPEEQGKVPDEATRRSLFDSLDRPL